MKMNYTSSQHTTSESPVSSKIALFLVGGTLGLSSFHLCPLHSPPSVTLLLPPSFSCPLPPSYRPISDATDGQRRVHFRLQSTRPEASLQRRLCGCVRRHRATPLRVQPNWPPGPPAIPLRVHPRVNHRGGPHGVPLHPPGTTGHTPSAAHSFFSWKLQRIPGGDTGMYYGGVFASTCIL